MDNATVSVIALVVLIVVATLLIAIVRSRRIHESPEHYSKLVDRAAAAVAGGNTQASKRAYERIVTDATRAIAKGKTAPHLRTRRGESLVALGDQSLAEKSADAAVARYITASADVPLPFPALSLVAHSLSRGHDLSPQAEAFCLDYVRQANGRNELDVSDAVVQHLYGWLRQIRDYATQKALGGRILAALPNAEWVCFELGKAACGGKLWAEASQWLDGAVALKLDRAESHYWLGVARLYQLQYPTAAAALRQAISLDPNLAAAHYMLAKALRADEEQDRLARFRDALHACEKASAIEPSEPQYWFERYELHRELGELSQALACAIKARALVNTSEEYALACADISVKVGNFAEAIRSLGILVETHPRHVRGLAWLGELLTAGDRYADAETVYSRLRTVVPGDVVARAGHAHALFALGRYADCVSAMVGFSPPDARTAAEIARSLAQVGQSDLSLAAFTDGMARFGTDGSFVFYSASALANEAARRAREGGPGAGPIWSQAGEQYRRVLAMSETSPSLRKACQLFEMACRQFSGVPVPSIAVQEAVGELADNSEFAAYARYMLGLALASEKRDTEAQAALSESAANPVLRIASAYEIGRIRESARDDAGALDHYARAVENAAGLEGPAAVAQSRLARARAGIVSARLTRWRSAREFLLPLPSHSVESQAYLGLAFAKSGKFSEAIRCWTDPSQNSRLTTRNLALAHFRLGLATVGKDQWRGTVAAWTRAHELNPEHLGFRDALVEAQLQSAYEHIFSGDSSGIEHGVEMAEAARVLQPADYRAPLLLSFARVFQLRWAEARKLLAAASPAVARDWRLGFLLALCECVTGESELSQSRLTELPDTDARVRIAVSLIRANLAHARRLPDEVLLHFGQALGVLDGLADPGLNGLASLTMQAFFGAVAKTKEHQRGLTVLRSLRYPALVSLAGHYRWQLICLLGDPKSALADIEASGRATEASGSQAFRDQVALLYLMRSLASVNAGDLAKVSADIGSALRLSPSNQTAVTVSELLADWKLSEMMRSGRFSEAHEQVERRWRKSPFDPRELHHLAIASYRLADHLESQNAASGRAVVSNAPDDYWALAIAAWSALAHNKTYVDGWREQRTRKTGVKYEPAHASDAFSYALSHLGREIQERAQVPQEARSATDAQRFARYAQWLELERAVASDVAVLVSATPGVGQKALPAAGPIMLRELSELESGTRWSADLRRTIERGSDERADRLRRYLSPLGICHRWMDEGFADRIVKHVEALPPEARGSPDAKALLGKAHTQLAMESLDTDLQAALQHLSQAVAIGFSISEHSDRIERACAEALRLATSNPVDENKRPSEKLLSALRSIGLARQVFPANSGLSEYFATLVQLEARIILKVERPERGLSLFEQRWRGLKRGSAESVALLKALGGWMTEIATEEGSKDPVATAQAAALCKKLGIATEEPIAFALAAAALAEGRPDRAVDVFEAAYKVNSKSESLVKNLAAVLSIYAKQQAAAGQHRRAVDAFRRSLSLVDDADVKITYHVYLHNKGVEAANASNYDGAIDLLRQSLSVIDSEQTRAMLALALFNRGVRKANASDRSGAINDVREGLKVDPKNSEGQTLLRRLLS